MVVETVAAAAMAVWLAQCYCPVHNHNRTAANTKRKSCSAQSLPVDSYVVSHNKHSTAELSCCRSLQLWQLGKSKRCTESNQNLSF